jgi:hypothetical protein
MILHAVSMVAVLVDQVQQAQCVFNCVLPTPEPVWKWWFGALAPWVGPLLSCVVSIFVAWKVFSWQGAKDRKQWILDQKKSDWRELLRQSAEIQRIFRMVNTPNKERIEKIVEQLKPAVHELSVSAASCVFLRAFFSDQANREKFYSFIRDADEASELIDALRSIHRYPDFPPTQQEGIDLITKILVKSQEVTRKYFAFNEWLLEEASEDLGISPFETSGMPRP